MLTFITFNYGYIKYKYVISFSFSTLRIRVIFTSDEAQDYHACLYMGRYGFKSRYIAKYSDSQTVL